MRSTFMTEKTMAAKKSATDSVEVEILGSRYMLRGGLDPVAVRSLAQDLDSRMRSLAEAAPTADPLKVAILTALRLADEMREVREQASSREDEIAERIDACAERVDRMLADAEDGAGRSARGSVPGARDAAGGANVIDNGKRDAGLHGGPD
jgi:cell division protein ZapA